LAGERRGASVPPARAATLLAATAALCLTLAVVFFFHGRAASNHGLGATTGAPPKSVAVLPFLDLTTQEMKRGVFRRGMTES